MTKKIQYPDSWTNADILDWDDKFECSVCDNIFDIGRRHIQDDGSSICDMCLEELS